MAQVKVTLKTRGKKLSEVMGALNEAKEKTLAIIRASKVQKCRSYAGMSRKRYKDTHDDREPEADGLTTFQEKLPDGRIVDAVLLANQHEEEWTVKLLEEEGVEEKEIHARGEVGHINFAESADRSAKHSRFLGIAGIPKSATLVRGSTKGSNHLLSDVAQLRPGALLFHSCFKFICPPDGSSIRPDGSSAAGNRQQVQGPTEHQQRDRAGLAKQSREGKSRGRGQHRRGRRGRFRR